jgi:penicillin-binding protein 1C
LALALGGVGMSLEELATLYAALGDDGLAKPLRHQEGGPAWLRPGRRLVSPDAAAQVLTILADAPTPKGRAPAVLMRDAPQIAFKTGTSYGYRDAWAIGVGAGHTVAVWVGRPDGAPRPGAMGRSDALPLLFDVFDLVGAGGAPVQRFRDPAAEPAPPALARFEAEGGRDLEIVFPPDGADVLVDAFGPSGRGLSLAAQGGRGALSWFAEGAPVDTEPTSGRAIWKPSGPGVHVVSVVDAQGRRARVSVRLRAPGA